MYDYEYRFLRDSKGFPDYSSFPRVLMVQVLSGSCGEFFTVMVSMP